MADKHHLFTITSWLLKAATIFCAFLTVVLALIFIAVVLALSALLVAPSLLPTMRMATSWRKPSSVVITALN